MCCFRSGTPNSVIHHGQDWFASCLAIESNWKKMRNNASLSIILSMTVLLAVGCATSKGMQGDDELSGLSGDSITHTVAPGDRLSDIALKYTGQIGQWEAIAAHNNITDPRTLRIGDTLTIPASMIPARKSALTSSTDQDAPSGVAATTTGTLALQRTHEVQGDAGDVLVAPVNTNRTFDLSPIETTGLTASHSDNSSPPQIRVIGSYYPKGVYQQPASYSKLMMRVAPGTIFELEQEVNDWYKVVTDQGVGYIRMIDGTLVSD